MKTLLPLLATLAALPANAAEFNVVVPEKSRIAFVSKQMGVPIEGGFGKFAARIAFDPARPTAGTARIDIELASIDAGNSEANDEVKGKNWFNSREFPSASFVASTVKALGGNRYEARGLMSIKGRGREVVAPFISRAEGSQLILEGSIPVMRLEYGIGTGPWADTATVADEVQVKFRFTLAAGK